MKKRKISGKLQILKNMPRRYHTLPGKDFSYDKSEVVKWMLDQDSLLDWLIQCSINSGLIVYDSETKEWRGINVE